ncbi:MAG: Coenzyme F420 hydrogenase/dehydrogenase, beta subunit C-terminal domain [Actinomycetota bacterium]
MTGLVKATSVAEVVDADLCIGCGLCAAVTGGRVGMALTGNGSGTGSGGGGMRPERTDAFTEDEERTILTACPGVIAEARPDPGTDGIAGPDRAAQPERTDPIWGRHRSLFLGWAGDPGVRFRAATGGVLTALGMHLLSSGTVDAILHVGADPDRPMRSRSVVSRTPQDVLDNCGSRYGPTSPLVGLVEMLDRGRRFAVIAKPCDLGAVHRYASIDPRVDELCVARLALVCGGQSKLSKSRAVLEQYGLEESLLSLFRYRGRGNPGPTRVETAGGQAFEQTYQEMWADESGWDLETRCKLCPDALGEAADVVAADAWPGGGPTGEDDGFNAVVVRTAFGRKLVAEAIATGDLVRGGELTPADLNDFQPHQVRKKEAVAARLAGVADAGAAPIRTVGLRIEELGRRLSPEAAAAQREGTAMRIRARMDARGP